MPRLVSQSELIKRFATIHGDAYSYERVHYSRMKDKVEILCSKHGPFWQTPSHHLQGTGCPLCQREEAARKKTGEAAVAFTSKAMAVHGKKYDYSRVLYSGNKRRLEIGCPYHGYFLQTASNHLSGFGCPRCGRERTEASRKLSSAEFFRRCGERHGQYYKYPRQSYVNPDSVIEVFCPSHGKFQIKARNHLWIGQGCRFCHFAVKGLARRVDWEEFREDAQKVHGDRFEYDQDSYIMLTEMLRIRCPDHGWFHQRGFRHLSGQACPICARQRHRGKWQSHLLPVELRELASALYCFRLRDDRELFYKIGISNDVERRRSTVQLHSGYKVEILYVQNGTLHKCMQMEEALHLEYGEYSYTPARHFPGYTECFSSDVLDVDRKEAPNAESFELRLDGGKARS